VTADGQAAADQEAADRDASAEREAGADREVREATADRETAGAEHTGESHDDAESAETIATATSAGGPVSAATEAASTHEDARQQTEREQAVVEQGILGAAPAAAHAPTPVTAPAAAAGTTAAPAPAALIESVQIRRAITQAEKRTDLNWSVFIGTLGDNPRAQAEARHAELGPAAAKSVLIAVDPIARRLEIVTGTHARTLLDDRSCALAAASMTSTFAVRDLDGGIAYGILAMVEHVRRTR
jgi:hypothetical protein